MKIEKILRYKLALKWGLILGGVNIVYAIIVVLLRLHYSNSIIRLIVPAIILLIVPILAILDYKKRGDTFFKLIHIVKFVFMITTIASLLIISYKLIFTTLIEPDFYETYDEVNRLDLFETHISRYPDMTWKQFDIDMAEGRNAFWKPRYTLLLIVQSLIGLITSLIMGLMMKKKKSIINKK